MGRRSVGVFLSAPLGGQRVGQQPDRWVAGRAPPVCVSVSESGQGCRHISNGKVFHHLIEDMYWLLHPGLWKKTWVSCQGANI